MGKISKDLTGQVFGRLTVLELLPERSANGSKVWKCRCSCGKYHAAQACNLNFGQTNSCGCLKEQTKSNFRHGGCGTREYAIWKGLTKRCYNPKAVHYHNYGGRGIKVCSRWRNSFENFLADMGKCPKGKSIDRFPDKDGDYKPSNCRWATHTEQARNRRNNFLIEYRGETKCLQEWAEIFGLKSMLLRRRLVELKLPFEKAINND